jgi:hypothetical protein
MLATSQEVHVMSAGSANGGWSKRLWPFVAKPPGRMEGLSGIPPLHSTQCGAKEREECANGSRETEGGGALLDGGDGRDESDGIPGMLRNFGRGRPVGKDAWR